MKSKCLLLLLVLVAFIDPHAFARDTETNEWGNAVNDIQIGIGIDGHEAQIKANQLCDLKIYIKNMLSKSLLVMMQICLGSE